MKKLSLLVLALALVFLSIGVVYADLDDGLVAYYKLDGDPTDESEYANHGMEQVPIVYLAGKFGQATSFDGYDDQIS